MEFTLLFLFVLGTICITSLFISLAIYFIPVIIAYIRKHNNIIAITVLTLMTGWTFFGWLGALLWSLNSDTKLEEDED